MVFGRYRLIQLLGRGGMGEVWKARMIGVAGFQRTVVVKRILPEHTRDKTFVDMFLGEARLSSRLMHPNIVQVYDLGQANGEYFMAMEYVRGTELVEVIGACLRRSQRIPIGLGVIAVRDICRALSYAHGLVDDSMRPLLIVHRDVNPANVMVSHDGVVKLLDFGIAKALGHESEERTRTGVLKGKFSYMSPQQAEGKHIDHRADLWAAGVILHELLAGRRLFKAENDLKTLARVGSLEIEPPSKNNPEVPAALDAICMKALQRDPDLRYQSGAEMADELEAVAAQLRWNTGSLGALMRELFPEGPRFKDGAAGEEVVDDSGPTMGEEDDEKTNDSASLPGKKPAWRASPAMWGGAAAALLATVILTIVLSRPTRAVPPPPAVVSTQPETVVVNIRSLPSGSEVFVDGETRGRTPVSLAVPRSERPLHVSVRRPGYQLYETLITPEGNQRFDAVLQEITSPKAMVAAPPPTTAAERPKASRRPMPRRSAPEKIDLDSPTF
jgi:eukaryotic-like serine/threonine-protein kinase